MSDETTDEEHARLFNTLLLDSTDIEPRLRALWLDIYRHAIEDRTTANVFLTNMLQTLAQGDPEKHSLHGPQAVKYLERISRANDQLLKLAEQVQSYSKAEGEIDSDDILDSINTK